MSWQNLASEEAKVACLKVVYNFLKKFLSFLGFSMVKIHFLQKVLKNWSSFRRNYCFPLLVGVGGGGGPDPKVEISTFLNPP